MKWTRTVLAAAALAWCGHAAVAQEGIDDPTRAQFYDSFKGKTIAYLPIAMGFDMSQAWYAQVKQAADDLGMKVEMRDPNWNTDAMAQAFTDLIATKPAVIVTQNPDFSSFAKLLKQAQKAGIYVIQVNMKSVVPTEAYVGPDFVGMGEMTGNMAVKQCGAGSGGSGKVAIVQGAITGGVSVLQLKGIMNVFKEHPEIKVVSSQAANWDATKARAIADSVLQQNEDLCAIVGVWDGEDTGVGAAVQQAGKVGKVAIFTTGGGATSQCDNVDKGIFTAAVNYDAVGMGRDIATMIKMLMQSKPAAGTVKVDLYSQSRVITKADLRPGLCWNPESPLK